VYKTKNYIPNKMAGQCGHEHHDHGPKVEDLGSLYTLYTKIDVQKVQCLNEDKEGSGVTVFKPWHERLDTENFVESDCDEELLFNIPFTGSVKLKGIIIIGGEDNYHPSKMKLYKNRPHMTFDDTGAQCDQEFDLQPDHEGKLEYYTKVAKFSNVEHLSIYLPSNFGEDTTKVYYIGFKGDFTKSHKHGVTICNYEARANPADHSVKDFNPTSHSVQ